MINLTGKTDRILKDPNESERIELNQFDSTKLVKIHAFKVPYLRQIIREANFSGGPGRVFPFSKGYAAWETDEIISMELYRNVALAFLCIFLTTLPLLSDLLGCAEVLLSVVLTMVNVSGLMHFWGKIIFS